MTIKNQPAAEQFDRLIEILKQLRAPNGCEWDHDQTAESLVPYLLEETYEVIEAIEEKRYPIIEGRIGAI